MESVELFRISINVLFTYGFANHWLDLYFNGGTNITDAAHVLAADADKNVSM